MQYTNKHVRRQNRLLNKEAAVTLLDTAFCVVGKTNVISNQFTTEYQSVILDCEASIKIETDEKVKALRLLIKKYSPNDIELGDEYIKKSFEHTGVIKLSVKDWSGKSKATKNS
ncbi:MAG: hypothetical protein B6I18_03590 [Bacteroidetes bacterium 4572_112]|nr:MAG: hypothetical protein B6I18_03590 [Bacteroidetes bacterium 4572_112]